MKYEVPIWEKYCLTLDEAAAYFGIGINKLREMTDEPHVCGLQWNEAPYQAQEAGRMSR